MRISTLLFPVALLLLAGAGGCVFGTFDDITRNGAVRPRPERCGECHKVIYREWKASAHAKSWTDRRYAANTSDHAFSACLPCHAPDSLYSDGTLETRTVDRDHGVDCVACHLDQGALVGPLPSTAMLRPHPIREAKALYEKSDLCGRCHEATFREWQRASPSAGRQKRTCQECHMPLVVRKVTQPDGALFAVLVAMEEKHPEREHRFDLGAVADFPDAARLTLTAGKGGFVVKIENRLPHALPTGDYGPRSVEVRLAFAGPDGRMLEEKTLVRSVREGTAVPALATVSVPVTPPPGATAVTAVLVRPATGPEGDIVLARAKARW